MPDRCPPLEDSGPASQRTRQATGEDHLESCPACRDEAATDRAISEAFRGTPRPQLSPFFDRRLLAALARERRAMATRRWQLRALRVYWVLAATAGVAIFLRLPWQDHALAASPVALATLVGGVLLPVALLLAALRKDPIDLLFEALDWLS